MGKHDIEVTMHYEHGAGHKPAVNVKVGPMGHIHDVVSKRFNLSPEATERVMERAFNQTQAEFWADAQAKATQLFGAGVEVRADGRSGGWCAVYGLPDPKLWGTDMLHRWRAFRRWVEREVDGRTGLEGMLRTIKEMGLGDNRPLYKTTIVVWSRMPGDEVELTDLAQAATDGDAYCSRQESHAVEVPALDPDFPTAASDFFSEGVL